MEELYITDQANQDEKICLFSMSKRYAYDKNINLETSRIAVLQLIIATFIMLKGESDLLRKLTNDKLINQFPSTNRMRKFDLFLL